MRVLKPPSPLPEGLSQGHEPSIFLAGSIEMGRAARWQDELIEHLSDLSALALNPRRDAWDASWAQTTGNPEFVAQVEWELAALEAATVIAMYLYPETLAPISLLELGLFARSGRMIVCCPDGFHRKGNVEVVCRRYGVLTVGSLELLASAVRSSLAARQGVVDGDSRMLSMCWRAL